LKGNSKLLDGSMLRLILGGAALQRCGNHIDLSAASAAEVRVTNSRLVLPSRRTAFVAVSLLALLFSTYTFADSGADIYKMKCSACHGLNGAGETMLGKNLKLRSLASAEVQNQSDDDLARIISKGKNKMPSYDRKLSKDQIEDVVKYIRSLRK
jgi:mono/diheme cytochrome c family protein